ncbi:MFS transporter [Aeromicrobium sp. YIM 150415]|uniref:alpha-ketoacid dehydrogenase subunit alpha/beta n=1 Tax=Aeromicrobium sp. YIM 150415 TaxID=2803912 RepID=UPI001966B740|nr:alpha-ketoacid dehydrogenase subunit alpha/beta [Aeromicrobium sp. YIM 150415]MBM9463455.1 MFS transporter [Aeromicrobium sp. YIM 150415]
MSQSTELHLAAPWVEIRTDDDDWALADPALLEGMQAQLIVIRLFEEKVLELAAAGLVHGPAHSSIGQEGGAVGSIIGLRSTDTVNGSHRGHHQFLAKALRHVQEKPTLDPDLSGEVVEVLRRTLAEICGLADGYCRGRGGSMHLKWSEAGAMGTNAIVGGGIPQALGFAWAHRQARTDDVSVAYFGDGAMNIGSALESLNLAAAWQLPVCFFVENNQYAVATTVAESSAEVRLSARGPGFGIPSWRVDGMDPLAVHLTMEAALARLRAGEGPVVVEADVYRYFHQNGPFPGSAFGYRDKAEEKAWRERDPIALVAGRLIDRGIADQARLDDFEASVRRRLDDLADDLLEPVPDGKPGERRIRPERWPDADFVDVGVLGDLSELADVEPVEPSTWDREVEEAGFVEVVADVMRRRLETDHRVVVMGEDIHRLNGGTNGATRGLADAFPDRVLGTPISENAFCGLAGGIALDGRYRPVVELMFADFMWVAADQIFNQIAKARHMFGGDDPVSVVIRSKVAAGTGYGSQHSMDPAGVLAMSQGLRIVAPSTPADYIGLMNAALACDDPVVVLEHVDLYPTRGSVPAGDRDYRLEVGRAAIRRRGDDVTILSYLNMVDLALQAAEEVEGLSAEVIDLRWLDRASVDWDTIEESVRRTNNVVIVEQGARSTSYGGWLADEIQRRCFDWLDQPVQRVTGGIASPSISKALETAALARREDIAQTLRAVDPRRVHAR